MNNSQEQEKTKMNKTYYWDGKKEVPEDVVDVVVKEGAIKIGDYAFAQCKSLEQITIPNSVKWIGDRAFCHCKSLKQITIPDSVTAIGFSAFYDCASLEQIIIPNSVEQIGQHAFTDCKSLKQITIPYSVTAIGYCAFYTCTSLQKIVLPTRFKDNYYEFAIPQETKIIFKDVSCEDTFNDMNDIDMYLNELNMPVVSCGGTFPENSETGQIFYHSTEKFMYKRYGDVWMRFADCPSINYEPHDYMKYENNNHLQISRNRKNNLTKQFNFVIIKS